MVPPDYAARQTWQRRIWLPTECWVDTLKLLSRRQLLRGVQPACRRLHAIAELHVPSMHIIRHFNLFLDKLEHNMPEAKQQYEELATNQAALGRHFRMGTEVHLYVEQRRADHTHQRRLQVLRNSLELFRNCRLRLMLHHLTDEDLGDYLAYLSLLAPARPYSIHVTHNIIKSPSPRLQLDALLREPTVLACPLLTFSFSQLRWNMARAETFCQWLHHLPTEDREVENKEGNAEQNLAKERIFILNAEIEPSTATEIIERCKQSFQQAESASDKRSYVIDFQLSVGPPIPLFKLENRASGEVLQLECRLQQHLLDGVPLLYHFWRFRNRWSRDQSAYFRTPMMEDRMNLPRLTIH